MTAMGVGNLGNFGVTIKAHIDSRSLKDVEFEAKKSGEKAGRGFALGWARAFRVTKALAASSLALNTIKIFSDMERRSLILANTLRMSPTLLTNFSGAFYAAGLHARELFGEMEKVESKMNRLKLGEVDETFMKSLGMLRVSFRSFQTMSGEQRLETVLQKALAMPDVGKARELMRNLYGGSGVEMFDYLRITGKSLSSILAQTKGSVLMTDEMKKKAIEASMAVRKFYFAIKELGTYIAVNVGTFIKPFLGVLTKLTPHLKGVGTVVFSILVPFALLAVPIALVVGVTLKLIKAFIFLKGVLPGIVLAFSGIRGAFFGMSALSLGSSFAWLKGLTFAGIGAALLPIMKIVLVLGALLLVLDDLYFFSKGKGSLIGDMFKAIEKEFTNSLFYKLMDFMLKMGELSISDAKTTDSLVKQREEEYLRLLGNPNPAGSPSIFDPNPKDQQLIDAITGISKAISDGIIKAFSQPSMKANPKWKE